MGALKRTSIHNNLYTVFILMHSEVKTSLSKRTFVQTAQGIRCVTSSAGIFDMLQLCSDYMQSMSE